MQMWGQGTYMYAGADAGAFLLKYPTPITLFVSYFLGKILKPSRLTCPSDSALRRR